MTAFPKSKPMRDGKYLRLIAAMPCFSCGIEGRSQAAHSNLPKHGKGAGQKASDYATFPLCAPTIGDIGCHAKFDQNIIVSKLDKDVMTDFYVRSAQQKAYQAGFVFPEGARYES